MIELTPPTDPFIHSAANAHLDCPFCWPGKLPVFEERVALEQVHRVFEPLAPVTPGHLLVVPAQHVESALEVPYVTAAAAYAASQVAAQVLQQHGVDGINLITSVGAAATQRVFHLHWHVVPRRVGDGLTLPWTGQVRP